MEQVEISDNKLSGESSAPKMDQKARQSKRVSLLGLFSAADKVDLVLMFVGSVGACVHGAALPVFFVLFGRMIDSLGHLSKNPHQLSSRISEVQLTYVFAIQILIRLLYLLIFV